MKYFNVEVRSGYISYIFPIHIGVIKKKISDMKTENRWINSNISFSGILQEHPSSYTIDR